MLQQNTGFKKEGIAAQKRDYLRPKLIYYGKVRHITQGGSGQASENAAGLTCSSALHKPHASCSDRAAKENIVRIGNHPLGIGLYLFDYKPEFREQWGHGPQFGVMADEVEVVMPEAVCTHHDGYQMVDYDMLGIIRSVH